MSIFGKKEGEQPTPEDPHIRGRGGRPYGIGDVIRLLRTLPIDQHGELVVRVIRTTLESVNVHVRELIQDATKQQQDLSQRIGTLHAKILELSKQIDALREEVARHEADLGETSNAKERLQAAEQSAAASIPAGHPTPPAPGQGIPVPLPPPMRPAPHRPPPPEVPHRPPQDTE